MIIRYICIHHILIKGYLSMNGKYALPCRFSFGEYSDEKLMSIHAANIQMFICRFIKSSDFSSVINPAGKWDNRESSHLL